MDKPNKHYKYHSIENIPTPGEFCNKNVPTPGEFIVTEKIDGSNFSIGYIENSLQIQSRNKIIDRDCKEFGLQEIVKPLIQIVEKVKDILKYNFLIFGEIFGKTIPTLKYYDPVCVDVFGSKKVFFRAFDLFNVDENKYLKYSDAIPLFIEVGLPYLPILNIKYKTNDDLLVIVEKYQSAFSQKFAEGFVLKKDENELASSRNIFKVKRKEFRAGDVQLLNKKRIKSFVNYNRFMSAYSKIGDDSEKIKEEMIRDSLEDIMVVIREEVKEEVQQNYIRFWKKLQNHQKRMVK